MLIYAYASVLLLELHYSVGGITVPEASFQEGNVCEEKEREKGGR